MTVAIDEIKKVVTSIVSKATGSILKGMDGLYGKLDKRLINIERGSRYVKKDIESMKSDIYLMKQNIRDTN